MNYKRIYDEFIADRRLKENMVITGYFERHHIIPKSMGGTNDASNLISLTAEDHIHAHLLLAKAYGGNQWFSVQWTFALNKREKIIPTKRMIRIVSLAKLSMYKNGTYTAGIEKLRITMATPEYRIKASVRAKEIQNRPEVAAKRNTAVKASRANPLFIERMKETTTASWNVEGERERRGAMISAGQKMSGKLKLAANTPEGKAHKVIAANARWDKARQLKLLGVEQ